MDIFASTKLVAKKNSKLKMGRILLGVSILCSPILTTYAKDYFRPLDEISPFLEEIHIIPKDPFWEIVIEGYVDLNCYDKKEYIIQLEKNHTEVIPRFSRNGIKKNCRLQKTPFKEKAGLIDPRRSSSQLIKALGYRGWIIKNMSELEPKSKNQTTQ